MLIEKVTRVQAIGATFRPPAKMLRSRCRPEWAGGLPYGPVWEGFPTSTTAWEWNI
jgi:hypothetical protein